MNEQNDELAPEQFYKNLLIIWIALFLSQFLFLLVIYVAEPALFDFDFTKPVLDQNSLIIFIFAGAAFLNLALSLFFRKKFIGQAISDQNVFLLQTALIVGCALSETVSLFGMMLAFIASYQYFFAWVILGTVGMIFHFPLRKNVMDASLGRVKRNLK